MTELVSPRTSPVPERPSAPSMRLAKFFGRNIRPLAELWQPRGAQLFALRQCADAAGFIRLPRSAQVWPAQARSAEYGRVRGHWLRTDGADPANGVLLHLHGGGFVFGSPRSHRALAFQLSKASGMPVFLPDYRRAPEHPYPAAPDDCLAAYRMLLDRGVPAERIRVVGDSAGGQLAAGLIADLARVGLPMPNALALYSPMLDLTCAELDELDRLIRDPFIPPVACRRVCAAYLRSVDSTDPRLDVLAAPKAGWPRTLIQAGGAECLRGDAARMADSLRAAGISVELQVWPGQIHVFQTWANLPEARSANRYTGDFLSATV